MRLGLKGSGWFRPFSARMFTFVTGTHSMVVCALALVPVSHMYATNLGDINYPTVKPTALLWKKRRSRSWVIRFIFYWNNICLKVTCLKLSHSCIMGPWNEYIYYIYIYIIILLLYMWPVLTKGIFSDFSHWHWGLSDVQAKKWGTCNHCALHWTVLVQLTRTFNKLFWDRMLPKSN